jgi:murein tripeptide amidase MpaA
MDFNHYFTNEELENILHQWAETYPNIVKLQSIGKSYEGRPIWVLTLTNHQTGPDNSKPALWIDANIHATEITGTTTALFIAYSFLTKYGLDTHITRLLDLSTIYILPRINPDGAALAMASTPRYIRSGTRPYPWDELDDGLHTQDINGDGMILQMRIPDPNGDWKISTLDARLMEKRGPDEHGGIYYRILPEGILENYDGYIIKIAREKEGLDFNRNFPFEWRTESDQSGAGPYPTSEPEIRAMIDFIVSHPNINIAITFHTFSRVILRPYSTKSDDELPTDDLWVFKKIGELGTQLTGYRCVSTFHDFKYHPKQVTTGAFDDWVYDHLGVYAYTIELWDLPTEAGIKERKFMEWWREHPHEEDVQILKWVDEHALSNAYLPWQPYDHPQLGKIELGGWNAMYTWRNPPSNLVGAEAARHLPFILSLCEILPRLSIHQLQVDHRGENSYHIVLVLENTGFLPSYTSQQCKIRRASRPVRVELDLSPGVELITGERRVEVGYLEGRSGRLGMNPLFSTNPTDNRAKQEWVIQAPPGSKICIRVLGDRAGALEQTIFLGKQDK